MRIPILCAAVLAAAHAATAVAQPAPAPLATGDGWVALTIADYLKLRDQANPKPPPPLPPPARATVSEMAYELTAGDGLATGIAELVIDVLDDGWIEVPLPPSLFVRAARLGGRPLAIVDGRGASEGRNASDGAAAGSRRILLSRKGRSLVTLDVAVPIAETAGTESIQLPPAAGGLLRAVLTVPRGDVAIVATGGTIVQRAGDAAAHRVTAHGAFGQGLGLSWSRQRDTSGASLPARLRGQLQHVVGLGEETALVTARVTVDVLRGGTSAFTLRLPAGLVVNQVQGAHVADWDVQGAGADDHAARSRRSPDGRRRQRRVPAAGVGPHRGAAAAPRRRRARDRRGRGRSARRRRSHEARGARPRSDRSVRPRRSADRPPVAGHRRISLPRRSAGRRADAGADAHALRAAGGAARGGRRGALSGPRQRGWQGPRRRPPRRPQQPAQLPRPHPAGRRDAVERRRGRPAGATRYRARRAACSCRCRSAAPVRSRRG